MNISKGKGSKVDAWGTPDLIIVDTTESKLSKMPRSMPNNEIYQKPVVDSIKGLEKLEVNNINLWAHIDGFRRALYNGNKVCL